MSFQLTLVRKLILTALLAGSIASVSHFTPASRAGQQKEYTAEQIVESAIAIAGNGFGRAVLGQIRRNGLEVGKETRTSPDGRAQETRYELRFVHGDKPEEDKVRLDSKTAQQELSLVWGNGRLF